MWRSFLRDPREVKPLPGAKGSSGKEDVGGELVGGLGVGEECARRPQAGLGATEACHLQRSKLYLGFHPPPSESGMPGIKGSVANHPGLPLLDHPALLLSRARVRAAPQEHVNAKGPLPFRPLGVSSSASCLPFILNDEP